MTPSFWTPPAQARRVFTDAWRFLRTDMALGILYVVITTFCFLPSTERGYHGSFVYPSASLITMTVVMLYMTLRLTLDEAQPTTGTFYFNLPRDSRITARVQICLLVAYALLLTLVIVGMVKLGVTSYRAKVPFRFPFMLMIAPYVCAALGYLTTRGRMLNLEARALLAGGCYLVYNLVSGWYVKAAYGASGSITGSLIFSIMVVLFFGSLMVFSARIDRQKEASR